MGPSWNDPQRWVELLEGRNCPLCTRSERPGIAATLDSCLVAVDETVNVRGYCCLILRRHATELHQLSADEGAAFVNDAQRVARVLQQVTGAIKLNYEIHGNIIPHIHLHIVPRYAGDPIERTGQGFAKIRESPYQPGEFERFTAQFAEALKAENPVP